MKRVFFESLLSDKNPFYVRVGIVWMKRFILKNNLENTINLLKRVENQNYFVKMALAWTYQEACIYDFDFMYEFIAHLQDDFIRLKTISKCCDSCRLQHTQKDKLKLLRKCF